MKNPRLLYLKYKDHVLFRKADPSLLTPCIRETIGWLIKETEEAFYLVNDKSVHSQTHHPAESGLIILQSDVITRRFLD
jgi:hypothetical protein